MRLFESPNSPSKADSFQQMLNAYRIKKNLPAPKVVVVQPTKSGILKNCK